MRRIIAMFKNLAKDSPARKVKKAKRELDVVARSLKELESNNMFPFDLHNQNLFEYVHPMVAGSDDEDAKADCRSFVTMLKEAHAVLGGIEIREDNLAEVETQFEKVRRQLSEIRTVRKRYAEHCVEMWDRNFELEQDYKCFAAEADAVQRQIKDLERVMSVDDLRIMNSVVSEDLGEAIHDLRTYRNAHAAEVLAEAREKFALLKEAVAAALKEYQVQP